LLVLRSELMQKTYVLHLVSLARFEYEAAQRRLRFRFCDY
jgi:hypothetical protein